MSDFHYCPFCKTDLERKEEALHCPNCGHYFYRNSKPTAAVFPIKDGKMLLGRRSKEPYKGEYDVLGGFLHEGEHPAEGALREAKEESGLDMRIITQLGIYMDTYGPEAEEHTLNVYHVAEITGGEMKPGDDVDLLEWWDIENPPALAFENNRAALRDLQLWYRQHAH